MKRFLMVAFCVFASVSMFGGVTTTARPQQKEQQGPKKDGIKDEVDKTDIFAVPVDTSETEEREEQKVLENLQQYEQRKAQMKQQSTKEVAPKTTQGTK